MVGEIVGLSVGVVVGNDVGDTVGDVEGCLVCGVLARKMFVLVHKMG